MSEQIKLFARETRLAALALDGDLAGTNAPIIASYLKEDHSLLFEHMKNGTPVYTVSDLIVSNKRGRDLKQVELIFVVPSMTEGEEGQEYSLELEAQYVMALFPMHLVGETYLALFASDVRMHNKSKAISNDEIQILIDLPGLGTPEFQVVANKLSSILSNRAVSTIEGMESMMDNGEAELLREERGKLLLVLSELASGSEKALMDLLALINPLNVFEENIIVNQHESTVEDDRLDAIIQIADTILSRTNIRNVLPKKMSPENIRKFQSDYDEFNALMEDFDDEEGSFYNELNELSANDRKFLEERGNSDALTSYLNAPISFNSLPLSMMMLADKINFADIYTTDWSKIDSISDFLDEDGNQPNSFGENVVISLIASIIRIGRISEINNIPPIMFLINILNDSSHTQDNHWELLAFSDRLAKGDTTLFKDLITILPKDVPMSTLLNVSYLGFIGFALARNIMREGWNQEIIRIALTGNELMSGFMDDVFENVKSTTEQYKEHQGDEEADEEHQAMVENQILFQSIQASLSSLGENTNSGEEIASSIIDAMLKMADLNTGKKTISAVNSQEWINIKKEYLNDFLSLNPIRNDS